MYYIFNLILPSFIKRKLIPKSLLSRFVLIIIIPTLIGQFFALHLFYERHWYNVSYHTSSVIITEIESLLQQKELYKNKSQVTKYLNLSYILLPNQTITSNNLNKAEELEILKKQLENKISYQSNVSMDENEKIKW